MMKSYNKYKIQSWKSRYCSWIYYSHRYPKHVLKRQEKMQTRPLVEHTNREKIFTFTTICFSYLFESIQKTLRCSKLVSIMVINCRFNGSRPEKLIHRQVYNLININQKFYNYNYDDTLNYSWSLALIIMHRKYTT